MGTVTTLPRGQALTRRDLDAMPDDGHRYELIDGALIVTPAPSERHQTMVVRLTVEVVSPSTRHIDLSLKRARYEAAGARSYWVVDPAGPSLTVWELEDGRYVERAHVVGAAAYDASDPFPVRVTPAELLD